MVWLFWGLGMWVWGVWEIRDQGMGVDFQYYWLLGLVGKGFLDVFGFIDFIMGLVGLGKMVCFVYKGLKLVVEYWLVCKDGWVCFKFVCICDIYCDFVRMVFLFWYDVFLISYFYMVEYFGGQDWLVKYKLCWKVRWFGVGEIKIEFQMEIGVIGDQNVE